MKKVLVYVVIVLILFTLTAPLSAANTLSDPGLNPGDSVVGEGVISPDLIIGKSGGTNDVKYLNKDTSPAAYGARLDDIANALNACMFDGWGIADMGDPEYVHPIGVVIPNHWRSRVHEYEFSFTNGQTVSDFEIAVADWGDFMPLGGNDDNAYALYVIAYDADGNEVDRDSLTMLTSETGLKRHIQIEETGERGYTAQVGDACTTAEKMPGNNTFHVSGEGIARVTVQFKDAASMDPQVAFHNIGYTLEVTNNAPPVAEDDFETTPLNTPVEVLDLTNDYDPDGDPIAITAYDDVSANGGSVVCDADSCVYTPPFGFTGVDTYNYTICDPDGLCDSAVATITIVNDYDGTGCTRTRGYWRTHANPNKKKYNDTWDQRLGETFFLSGEDYLSVLKTKPRGNAYYILSAQYIAAEMNMRAGTSIPDAELAAFQQATELFEQYTPDTANDARADFVSLGKTLDAYNNGVTGPGHCN